MEEKKVVSEIAKAMAGAKIYDKEMAVVGEITEIRIDKRVSKENWERPDLTVFHTANVCAPGRKKSPLLSNPFFVEVKRDKQFGHVLEGIFQGRDKYMFDNALKKNSVFLMTEDFFIHGATRMASFGIDDEKLTEIVKRVCWAAGLGAITRKRNYLCLEADQENKVYVDIATRQLGDFL